MRSTVRYTDSELYDKCCSIKAKYEALVQKELPHWNVSVRYSPESCIPVPEEHLLFACALVARYHNELCAP